MTPHDELLTKGDPALAGAAEAGDECAFAVLYERHAPIVWRFAVATTGEPAEAGAVLVETFARVFTIIRAGHLAPDTTFRTLALTVARNTALDRARGRVDARALFDYATGPARVIGAAFAPLPERWRAALWLSEIEGVRPRKVAPVVGLATEATDALTSRARTGLREQYLHADFSETGDRNCARAISRLGVHVEGTLPDSDAEKLERHLRLCDACTTRHREIADLGQQLQLLVVPLPSDLEAASRTAWSGVVVTTATRTGLSPRTEKVLAGVSAFAAAVGVLGATLFGATPTRGNDQAAANAAPAASEATTQPALELDGPVLVDLPGTSTARDSFGAGARQGTNSRATTPDAAVIGTSNPAGAATPASDLERPVLPVLPRSDRPVRPERTDAPPATAPSPTPAVSAGVTIADVPVAVEIGEDPGLTVGPVSVGSQPAPSDTAVEVGGPLAPLAPAAAPVSAVVSETTGALGL